MLMTSRKATPSILVNTLTTVDYVTTQLYFALLNFFVKLLVIPGGGGLHVAKLNLDRLCFGSHE